MLVICVQQGMNSPEITEAGASLQEVQAKVARIAPDNALSKTIADRAVSSPTALAALAIISKMSDNADKMP